MAKNSGVTTATFIRSISIDAIAEEAEKAKRFRISAPPPCQVKTI
jgi:hypothetical protein